MGSKGGKTDVLVSKLTNEFNVDTSKRLTFGSRIVASMTQFAKQKRSDFSLGLWLWNAVVILLSCQEAPAFPKPPILNVSTDLSQLPSGYQKANMLPDIPGQDSAPLLNDAIRWVSHYNSDNPTNPYTRIIAQPGVYYFLTTTPVGGRHVYVVVAPENSRDQFQNVTIDLGDSSLFFANALYEAFDISNCNNLLLTNFSIDYQILPFTQLRVQEVVLDTSQVVAVPEQAIPPGEYVDVYQLQQSQPGATLHGFDFRNGRLNPSTARWNISTLSGPSTILTLKKGVSVAFIRPGDTLEVEARGGGPAISVQSCSSILLQGISIYATGGIGIETNYSPGVAIANVQIIRRPHTNRLVSTNAGGIAVNQTAESNIIQNCTISGTQDDCISGNAAAVGYVQNVEAPSTCILAQPNSQLVSVGSQVYFVDPSKGDALTDPSGLLAVFTIASLQPTGTQKGSPLAVTMQTPPPLPTLPSQAMMYSTNPATRGAGLSIDSNDISSNTLARGIALSGQVDVTITNNTLSWIQEAGIICGTNYAENTKHRGDYSTYGPLSNINILNNHLQRTNIGVTPLGITMLAAIQILTINVQGNPVTAQCDQGISIIGNEIDETPRTGIWVMNVKSGQISGNSISNFAYDPALPKGSHINSQYEVTTADFKQPIVVQSSSVTVGGN
jgi:hypothetical protein